MSSSSKWVRDSYSAAIIAAGFTAEEVKRLSRAARALRKWYELECNGDVERNAEGVPVRNYERVTGKRSEHPIPDLEAKAENVIVSIIAARNFRKLEAARSAGAVYPVELLLPYYQGDPRGGVLYLVPANRTLSEVESTYSSCLWVPE